MLNDYLLHLCNISKLHHIYYIHFIPKRPTIRAFKYMDRSQNSHHQISWTASGATLRNRPVRKMFHIRRPSCLILGPGLMDSGNDWPMTSVSEDPEDLEPQTNHLLSSTRCFSTTRIQNAGGNRSILHPTGLRTDSDLVWSVAQQTNLYRHDAELLTVRQTKGGVLILRHVLFL